jgi:hypothetical protein
VLATKTTDFTASTRGAEIALLVLQSAVFDLTSNPTHRTARNASIGSSLVTILAHIAGVTVLSAIPVSRVVTVKTELPSIQAFVVTPTGCRRRRRRHRHAPLPLPQRISRPP